MMITEPNSSVDANDKSFIQTPANFPLTAVTQDRQFRLPNVQLVLFPDLLPV